MVFCVLKLVVLLMLVLDLAVIKEWIVLRIYLVLLLEFWLDKVIFEDLEEDSFVFFYLEFDDCGDEDLEYVYFDFGVIFWLGLLDM